MAGIYGQAMHLRKTWLMDTKWKMAPIFLSTLLWMLMEITKIYLRNSTTKILIITGTQDFMDLFYMTVPFGCPAPRGCRVWIRLEYIQGVQLLLLTGPQHLQLLDWIPGKVQSLLLMAALRDM